MENIVLIPIDVLRSEISNCVKRELQTALSSIQRDNEKEELLTRKEAAKLLGVSLPTLHDYTLSGKVQGYRLGTRVRYKRSEIETSLNQIKSTKAMA